MAATGNSGDGGREQKNWDSSTRDAAGGILNPPDIVREDQHRLRESRPNPPKDPEVDLVRKAKSEAVRRRLALLASQRKNVDTSPANTDAIFSWLRERRFSDEAVGYALRRISVTGSIEQAVALAIELRSTFRTLEKISDPGDYALRRLRKEHEKETFLALHRSLGEDHPETLDGAFNLALSYAERGEIDSAYSLATDTYARMRKVLGVEHPKSQSVRKFLRRLDANTRDR
ncbi:tetratricopeptide repeat protein [Parafrankia sp. FMc6]|uniref:hypothetical protein n=1 Tax=Parafrankia soli TaxID=2599596 RepID=UPI0034D5BA8D